MEQDIINDYEQRAALAGQQADDFKKQANTYSLLRLGVFALIILAVCIAISQDNFTILAISFVVLLFCFAWLVSRQAIFERQKRYFQDLKKVNENEIGSILNYENIYNNGNRFSDEKHHYSADLDIFGTSSLFQLINRAATSTGVVKLAAWLGAASTKDTIELKQDAVKELAAKNNWKLELQALLLFANIEDINQLQKLFKYLYIPLNLPGERWLSKYVKVAPFILLAAILLAYFYPITKLIAIFIGMGNLGIVFSRAVYIKKTDLIAGKIGDALNNYAIVFEKIEKEQWQSAYSNNLVKVLKDGNMSAKIKELSSLINKLNYHLNIIVGFILNLFLLWDIRQIIAIENWKRENQETLEAAFDVIGEFEALISLSSLAINYPDWCFPEIAAGTGYTLTAKNLAHPLISSKKKG